MTFAVCWLPPNSSWLDQVEIWLSILQRKLLAPNHFPSTSKLEDALRAFMVASNHGSPSGDSAIIMVEPAQDGHCHDRPIPGINWESSRRIREVRLEPLMWSRSIEVGNIGLEDSGKLPLMKNDQMIEALAAHAPQEALTTGVGARSVGGGLEDLYPGAIRAKSGPNLLSLSRIRNLGACP